MAKPKPKPLSQRVKHNPVLLKRALKDPGLRSKLPDRYLTSAQRSARKKNQFLDTPLLPGADITNRTFGRMRQSQERLAFGEAEQAQRQAGYDLREQTKRDSSYFDQYRQTIADAQTRQAEVARQANEAAAGVAQAGQTVSDTSRDQVIAAKKAEAEKTGAVFNEAAYRQLADAASAVRQNRGAQNTARVAGDGVGQNALLGQLTVSAQAGKGARMDQLRAAATKLSAEKSQLAGKKADWRQKFYYDQLNEARKRILEDKTYNIKAADLAAGIANDQADNAAAGLKTNRWGYTDAEWAAMSEGQRQAIIREQKLTGKDPKTTKPKKHKWDSSADHVSSFKQALSIALKHKNSSKVGGSSMSLQKWLIADAKRNGFAAPDVLLVAAAEVAKDGGIHQATAERIRKELNIRVTPFGYKIIPTGSRPKTRVY